MDVLTYLNVCSGEGQLIGLELVSVSGEEEVPNLGEFGDLTAVHCIRFPPANPHSVQQKTLSIRNNTHLDLPFHWKITQPNLQPIPGESPEPTNIHDPLANDDVFHISPASGLLASLGDHEFLLTYNPKELMDYHSICHLVMQEIPELPQETRADDGRPPQFLDLSPKVKDVIVMVIEVKGWTETYQVLLEPYSVHVPGEVFINTTIRRTFKMWNNSRSRISFQWDRITDCHIIEVEPPAGEIEVNECCDLELVLTGGRPGTVESILLCHVQHHLQAVALPIQVTFKGPQVKVNVARLDLGLIRLGDQSQTSLVLTNTSQLDAPWCLQPEDMEVTQSNNTQVSVEPCRGVLPPLASCCVTILFRARSCQHFATVLELAVENGQGCHLSVEADVQSPQVCLLSCELSFSDIYVGIPAVRTFSLLNQTLLPAHYTWTKLQGQQASLCSAIFTPSSGTLGPHAKTNITVAFTVHTDMEICAVAALCEVSGMKDPLVLGFCCKAQRLNISYSLPKDGPKSGNKDPGASLVLDFGDNVLLKQPVTKQLVLTNHTAIPAPFRLEAAYFTGHPPSPPTSQSKQIGVHVRKPLHSAQAKKLEARAQEGFVNGLLAHGKGAAFFVKPECGILGAFETQTVDITAFTNMWGDYEDQLISKVGDLQPHLIPIQMKVRGCPLYFQMIGPQPDNQNQGPIIRFGSHISGGDTISRSLRLINSSPYDIRLDWESFNIDPDDRKLLDVVIFYGDAFPLKDTDGNVVMGGALPSRTPPTLERSHTQSTARTSSSFRSMSDSGEEEAVYPTPPERKLVTVSVRPHEGTPSDYPYCITPQQIVVSAGGSSTIHVSFTPLVLSGMTSNTSCVAFALGFMSLDSRVSSGIPGKVTRSQGLDLQPLRLDLLASVRPAVLSAQMEEDEDTLEFCTVASDLIEGQPDNQMVQKECVITRTFQLKNNTEMPLSFRLSATPPFSVLQPEPCLLLWIQPRNILQVMVAFHSSSALLAYLKQPAEALPASVSILTSDSGERKLRFQGNLSVQYSNNSLQTIPLCAHLVLPTVHLSCDRLDFGTCYVGQTQVREVHLYNRGSSSSYWKALIDSDDKEGLEAFSITPDFGVLKSLEHPVSFCRESLQISFTASEVRDLRAKVTIQGLLGEPPLSLHLHGSDAVYM
ncbi:hypothetical protein UPYG_G00069720 [Umbra pygmaea]|uniref:HYDIN/VesB/CFA65-like Ig-like domain-containing protein n=1 Tax=Umbra pygmaea TaxID=75934 RepID=A0ABD0XBA5_UMBPY